MDIQDLFPEINRRLTKAFVDESDEDTEFLNFVLEYIQQLQELLRRCRPYINFSSPNRLADEIDKELDNDTKK